MTTKSKAKNIALFIAKTSAQGKDPAEEAKREIAEIDAILKEADKHKLRRVELIAILNHLGDDLPPVQKPVITDDSPEITTAMEKVIAAIADNGPMTVREIIQFTKYSPQEEGLIIRAVKQLGMRNILDRDAESRVIPGASWQDPA